ncbi:hypothetical protein EYZ11_012098 [Aspergillus tanneri]|uniref:RING-type E3 ubiquitin transferase n=1 Tax=Aspergillus tanneri TaxID=1220188 RepID=A0A4S3J384_9EURO|nr:hypothetical protein EYZ11_012098 [Aspergillus tanneri]
MSDDVDIQQEILQRTLQEVVQEENDEVANPCVICLEPVSESALAVPCQHANFDFLCLMSWLEQRRTCPLCKSDVQSVLERDMVLTADDALQARGHKRPMTPFYDGKMCTVISYIRSELALIAFRNIANLPPTCSIAKKISFRAPANGYGRLENRRSNNAEFLLEYVIAILRTVDIKGSAGQAEDLLRDFLGRDNARLFLHELQAWLRSPFTSLEDWDRNVQYEDAAPRVGTSTGRQDPLTSDRTSTPVYRGRGRGFRDGVTKSHYLRRPQHQGRSNDPLARARRLQHARNRYAPD